MDGSVNTFAKLDNLVMAAYVFPLAVKLLLQEGGQYRLNDQDETRATATDKLLSSSKWVEDRDAAEDESQSWRSITSKVRRDLNWNRVWESVKKKHPDMFAGD